MKKGFSSIEVVVVFVFIIGAWSGMLLGRVCKLKKDNKILLQIIKNHNIDYIKEYNLIINEEKVKYKLNEYK